MMERAARLRKLERQRATTRNEGERLKSELEQKLRETRRRQADEARKAAEKMKEELEEAVEGVRRDFRSAQRFAGACQGTALVQGIPGEDD